MEKNYKFDVFQNDKNIDLTLFQYGWEHCVPLHSYGPAKRNHYLFHYIFSGKGTLDANDWEGQTHHYKLEANQGFLILPGQITTYCADQQLPWEYAWLEFDGVKTREFLEMAGLRLEQPVYRLKRKEYAAFIKDELMEIIDNPYHSPINQIGHLYLFFDGLIRGSALKPLNFQGKLKDFYVREAVNFMELNYMEDITMEDVADYCGLNRSYLGRLFRESMNQTPQHFLMYYRMKQAAELLKLTDKPISEIGKACGYGNQLHFSRAFKNIFGISPNFYRRKERRGES